MVGDKLGERDSRVTLPPIVRVGDAANLGTCGVDQNCVSFGYYSRSIHLTNPDGVVEKPVFVSKPVTHLFVPDTLVEEMSINTDDGSVLEKLVRPLGNHIKIEVRMLIAFYDRKITKPPPLVLGFLVSSHRENKSMFAA